MWLPGFGGAIQIAAVQLLPGLSTSRNVAKARFDALFYPSVKTDGNESKKAYSLPSLLRDGQ
jgi:hypothetical protein